jgi:hypothetical protein
MIYNFKNVYIPGLLLELSLGQIWSAGLFPTGWKWIEMGNSGTFTTVVFGSVKHLMFLCISIIHKF